MKEKAIDKQGDHVYFPPLVTTQIESERETTMGVRKRGKRGR